MINDNEMARMVRKAIDGYFRDLDGEKAYGVYGMVISCVEKPLLESVLHRVLIGHLNDLYQFYGEYTGVRVARKHISWYTKGLAGSAAFRHAMNQLETSAAQLQAVNDFFAQLAERGQRLTYVEEFAA